MKLFSSCESPVYVVDGARSPFLKAQKGPGPFSAGDLAVGAGKALLARQPFEPTDFDEVILGCVMPGPEEVNIGRVVSLRLGCGKKVPAWTVQRNCASGMQALDCAARNIAHGHADLILAGGTEAMSRAPLLFTNDAAAWFARFMSAKSTAAKLSSLAALRPSLLKPVIGLIQGLTDHYAGLSMGETAEILADRFNVSRSAMDAFSVESHHRAAAAREAGFSGEIAPLYDTTGKLYDQDTGVREDSTVEKLGKLRPAFEKFGSVTAANSAQITDGAALLILASETAVKKWGLAPIGRIEDCQWAGLDPAQMGLGPAFAINKLLSDNKMKLDDIELWEINEAFAAQTLACLAALNSPDFCREEFGREEAWGELYKARLNIDGGAIALGHPVGASGARIVLRLFHQLVHDNANRGVASLCIGGGQGGAMLLMRD